VEVPEDMLNNITYLPHPLYHKSWKNVKKKVQHDRLSTKGELYDACLKKKQKKTNNNNNNAIKEG